MKTEINEVNKAKFFAQYWNQEILGDNEQKGKKFGYVNPASLIDVRELHLRLKSLSNITDEDAKEVSKLCTSYEDENPKNIKRYAFIYAMKSSVINDYLRSKGYLLPFMDLTTNEIIAAGWAEIK